MKLHTFESELWLPQSPEELFLFFSNASNLEQITPPWLNFIDYRLRVHGFPVRWRTRINAWEPPHRFVDEQIRGPYRRWVHEHTFTSAKGGTRMHDKVTYAVPLDVLVHRLFVLRDIKEIFQFRSGALRRRFGAN
jgi:ligand-binding SRPBCC domain-containing protein